MMVWSFEEAEQYLNDTAPPGKSVYGLGRINHLLEILHHPENGFKKVTIVGTNGKGSTIAFLDAILLAHGLKVACHIKPHLEEVTERIRINGVDSTPEEFAAALWEVKTGIDSGWTREDRATYFELIFAAFLCAAKNAGVEIVLMEAGLGGRLDAVNSVDSDLVVLTSIGFDHTELLGETIEEITGEKVAVVRPGSILVVQENPGEVMDVIDRLKFRDQVDVRLCERQNRAFELGLNGPYQDINSSLALAALDVVSSEILPESFPGGINPDFVRMGLKNARLPGRWEQFISDTGIRWIIDGGHNESGLEMVLKRFKDETSGTGTIIFGLKKTKAAEKIIPMVVDSAGHIIFTRIPYFESWEPENLESIAGTIPVERDRLSQIQIDCADSIEEGIEIAEAGIKGTGSVLITGSLYMVGEARGILKKKVSESDPG
ncbi:MAG: Mur ligase family protein [bacterium]|nr:Mur ligase family protein [bacterium]